MNSPSHTNSISGVPAKNAIAGDLQPSQAKRVSNSPQDHPGPLVLVGGGEFQTGCDFDRDLANQAGSQLLLIPTAAAYENPSQVFENASSWFASFGVTVHCANIFTRHDADDKEMCKQIAESRFIYISGGSALHLKSVLKGSLAFQALEEAWRSGATVIGSSAGAMVLTDPMVDPRGGAFTLGLGLVEGMSVVPHYESYSDEKAHRTVGIAPQDLALVGIDAQTAIIRQPSGGWSKLGSGRVFVYRNRKLADLTILP